MGKINAVLKWLFIGFNGFFAVLGGLMVFGTVKATAYSHQLADLGGSSLVWCWVLSLTVLGLSCLGVYAAYKEKALPLKIFAGFMGLGMVIMFILGFIMVSTRNKIRDAMDNLSDDVVEYVMRDESMHEALNELQPMFECCGLKQASDWGQTIPASCDCTHQSEGLELLDLSQSECQARPQESTGPDRIYQRPCSVVVSKLLHFVFQIAMGIFFGFGVIALLGLLLTLLMLHQVKRRESVGGASMGLRPY